MRILMVSPYPPVRDGIANYAMQTVARLRAEGHQVEVLSPGPSAAHHHLQLAGWRGPLALAKRVRGYDKVIVQFHPDVFYPQRAGAWERVMVSAGLALAFREAREIEVKVHEIDYSHGRKRGLGGLVTRVMWHMPDRVVVHTEKERAAFHEAFGVPESKIELAEHGADFFRRTSADRRTARATLGIPEDVFMFLSIGFIQPHKGFDRAIRAFNGLGSGTCRLDVVGSVRVEDAAYVDHLEDLRHLAAATPGVTIHEEYVSDEAFDCWLVASDVVVLPYRHIWSSSVIERAALYERPVIATRVGGLEEQARAGTVMVDDDDELAAVMRDVVRAHLPSRADRSSGDWRVERPPRWDEVMAEIRSRAAAERGPDALSPARRAARSGNTTASAPLRRIPALSVPQPVSRRPGVSWLKRLMRRLTAWEVDPIVDQLNRVQRAAVEVSETLAARGHGEGQTGAEHGAD